MVVPPRPGLFEVGVIQEVFGVDRTDDGVPAIDFRACTEIPGQPVQLDNGMSMVFPHGLEAADEADLVVAPAYGGDADTPPSEAVLDVFRRAHARGAWVLSVCSGAFLLGHAGLLDGRACTTHWRHTEELRALLPRRAHRPRRALRRGRPRHHQRRHRRRHRRLPAPRALRARGRRGQQDRAPDGGPAAARRRPAPVHRPAHPDLRRRQPLPAPHLDARAPRRGPPDPHARRAGRHVGAHLRPAVRRRDRHDAGQVAARPAAAPRPRAAGVHATCRSRRSPLAAVSARPRCCATTSGSTSASLRPSTAARSGPRTSAPAEPVAATVGACLIPPAPWQMHGQLWISLFRVRAGDHPEREPGVYGAALVSYEEPSPLTYSELLVARPVDGKVNITDIWVDSPDSRDGGRDLWAIPKGLCDLRPRHHGHAGAAHHLGHLARRASPIASARFTDVSRTMPAPRSRARPGRPGTAARRSSPTSPAAAGRCRAGARGSSTRPGRSAGWRASARWRPSGWPTSRCRSAGGPAADCAHARAPHPRRPAGRRPRPARTTGLRGPGDGRRRLGRARAPGCRWRSPGCGSSPSSPRAVDRPALTAPVRFRTWLRGDEPGPAPSAVGPQRDRGADGRAGRRTTGQCGLGQGRRARPAEPEGPRRLPGLGPAAAAHRDSARPDRLGRHGGVAHHLAAHRRRGCLAPHRDQRRHDPARARPQRQPGPGAHSRRSRPAPSRRRRRGPPAGTATLQPHRGLLATARTFRGLPYLWGGLSGFGLDCSGLTWLSNRLHGTLISRDALPQSRHGARVARAHLRRGDLVFYATRGLVHHVTMYAGRGRMIEAPHTGAVVRVVRLRSREYAGARRY